jgi:hypothetical protein
VAFGGQATATRHVRLLRDGRWTLSLRLGAVRVQRPLQSGGRRPGAPPSRPTVLVTGDSTVQGIDTLLHDRLESSARVVRAWRGGSAVSPDKWHWPQVAAAQARRQHPRITVISIGANEGWPIRAADGTSVPCCGPDWQAPYAGRIRSMMRSYARAGKGIVLWLLLPTPASPARQTIATAVNAAVASAAADVPEVRLVHLEQVLSPGGTFHRTLRYHGRTRVIREPDGIHLTLAGAAIATDVIMREIGSLPGALG